ncbi:uncharacterized protein LOC102804992 [Saccoglossus kowalevskii]|uniref:Pre-mRNA-splicing factor CWC22 homolog n=1 Tax=Saccoglossus kowalevskii TaxID=10224 RepID=A0ABM0LY75_SACKO|nr:PREDICTED: pre-mRNA-splicing factor CWC22 homolog [Saccoglossus kowalevskii]
MSTFVLANNHAHAIHSKKKVDMWFKEQSINVGKLGRGQQAMYKTLLNVTNEKRRLRKKKYIQQQELVKQQLREKAAKERHDTAMEMSGLKRRKKRKDLQNGLPDIGEDGEEEANGKRLEESTRDEKDQSKQHGDGNHTQSNYVSNRAVYLETPVKASGEKKNSEEKNRLSENTEPGTNSTETDVSFSTNSAKKTDITPTERSELGGQFEDNLIDIVSVANKKERDLNEQTKKRKEKKVKEPVGLFPSISLTTSYLTHGAPERDSDKKQTKPGKKSPTKEEHREKSPSPEVNETKQTERKHRMIKKEKEPEQLPGYLQRSSGEGTGSTSSSSVGDSVERKGKPERKVNIRNFKRFTRSIRIPSNVHIPRVSNVTRYRRNENGSLVPSEISVRPADEDYKIPSLRQAYFVKKALKEEKDKARQSEKKLQDFYGKMESLVPSRLAQLDHPIQSPSRELFTDGHVGQPKLGFSASLLAQMGGNTVEGDVHDLKNCKYIRFHEIVTPEQRELLRRRRQSSWGQQPESLPTAAPTSIKKVPLR